MFQIFETFRTIDEAWIVMFGVSNAKYLAFDIPDENTLRRVLMISGSWESHVGLGLVIVEVDVEGLSGRTIIF